MVVSPNPHQFDPHVRSRTKWPAIAPSPEFQKRSARSISIGLINNMSDGALRATERQFLSLLDSASDGMSVRLALYSLPGVPRNEVAARHIRKFYASVEDLRNTHLDGLIVTGREPLTPHLADEPYWESFTKVLDWARDNTYSTVWSCLAAHAAVLHMRGIRRIRSNNKHCGIFDCARLSDHPLMADAPSQFKLAHSRWNGLPEDELTACGYSVLTRSAEVGVDTFIKQEKSLFVFFQGHPEYESDTLLLEYRRDVGRYLRKETDSYPSMPRNYFDRTTAIRLTELQKEAISGRREELLAEVSNVLGRATIENTWRSTAGSMYRNWLVSICAQKQLSLNDSEVAEEPQLVGSSTPVLTAAV